METPVRHAAVAGRFYPGSAETLLRDVQRYTETSGAKIPALGCIVPHAGYMYSGHVAGAVYSRIKLPSRFIILCPNHTGMGAPLSVISQGCWSTPLGDAKVDSELALALIRALPTLAEDMDAHRAEHAIEVQVPFLQALLKEFSFVPIAVGTTQFDQLEALGKAIGTVIQGSPEKTLVIASSDMNHYESDEVTRVKDKRAIDPVLKLDPRGLWEVVTTHHISMCGFGPAVAMLTAAKLLGATKAELVKYATSGDVSGERDTVVGYAGIAIS